MVLELMERFQESADVQAMMGPADKIYKGMQACMQRLGLERLAAAGGRRLRRLSDALDAIGRWVAAAGSRCETAGTS